MTLSGCDRLLPMAVSETTARWCRVDRMLIGILVVGLGLRAGATFWLWSQVLPDVDQPIYDDLAWMLATQGTLGLSIPTQYYVQPGGPTSFWMPLYPGLLAAAYSVFGRSILAARLVQVGLGVLACWLTYKLGKALFTRTVGFSAAGLAAVYPHFIYLSLILLTENLHIVLVAVLLLGGLRAIRTRSWGATVWTGVAAGLATLTRPATLGLSLVIFAWLVWNGVTARRAAAGLVGLCLVLSPWVARNYLVHREFVPLTTEGGMVLFLVNHPRMVEIARGEGQSFWGTARYFLGHRGALPPEGWALFPPPNGASEVEYDRRLARQGIGFVLRDPMGLLVRLPERFVLFWNVVPRSIQAPGAPLAGIASFGLLLPLIVFGAIRTVRGNWSPLQRRGHILIGIALGYLLLLNLLFGTGGIRARLPVEPLLLVLASVGLVALPGFRTWIAAFSDRSPLRRAAKEDRA